MERLDSDYLEDILLNVYKAIAFTRSMDFDAFVKDEKTVYAVIRALEIIGEAAGRIPADFCNKHPELPWKTMKGMRNILIHAYFGVDYQTIWLTIRNDLPGLIPPLEKMLPDVRDRQP